MYLPTTAILTRFFGLTTRSTNFRQFVRSGSGVCRCSKLADEFVEPFCVQHQRHFVNGVLDIARFDDRFVRNVAEHRKLLPQLRVERLFGAANQDLRLQTDLAQLGDALLGRLGFQFAGRLDVRHERDVHVHDVLRADFENELADRFEKRQPFDVAGRAADFGDDDIVLCFRRRARGCGP